MTFVTPNTGAKTSFNETISESTTTYIEGSATYNLIPANFRQFTSSSGATSAVGRMFKVSTGTSVGGYGAIQSFRALPHRVGKSSTCKFSGYFESSVANSWQGMGLISVGEEMSFGYNGADFGVWHRYGGLPEVRTITVTGASGGSTNLTLTLNSVAYTIPLTTGTVQHNAYEIAAWLNNSSNQSVWGADQVNDTIIINALSDGDKSGTYSFSHGTATGGIAQNTAGVTKTSNHTPQTSWNGKKLLDGDFTLDPSKGNLYEIQYQNMGFGDIIYSVINPVTREFEIVHTLRYPNTTTILGIPNPSMRAGFYAVSTGSTTDLSVYMNSIQASVDGKSNKTRNPRAFTATQNVTTTNETAILAIRNRKTYNNYNNQIEIEPLVVSVSNDTNRSARIRVRSVQDTGIEQNFVTVGTNLVADVSTTAINFTGGRLLSGRGIAAGGEKDIDLTKLQISLPPGLMLIISVQRAATGGSNTNFEATLDWYEDL